jgi:hypothetical protein
MLYLFRLRWLIRITCSWQLSESLTVTQAVREVGK